MNNSFVLSAIEVIFGRKLSQYDRQPQCYVNNSFVLSAIEVIFGVKLS